MASLYNIRKEIENALANIEPNPETGEVTGWDEIERLESDFSARAEQLVMAAKEYENINSGIDAEIKRLQDQKKYNSNQINRINGYLTDQITALGQREVRTGLYRVCISESSSVVIAEGAKLPEQYLRYKPAPEPEPDKTALRKALKAGEIIEGATLVPKKNIVVK